VGAGRGRRPPRAIPQRRDGRQAMTISLVPEDTRLRRFECTGGETVFAVTFPVFAAGDVQVVRLRAGETVTLTNPGDYTLSGVGHPSGFTVTLTAAAQAGDLIVVVSAQPAARSAEWTDGQALRAQALNAEFARWWIALQQVRRDVARTVRLPLTDPSAGLELPAANVRAGKFLGFDGAGVAVAMGAPDAPLGAVARSGDTMTGFLTLHANPTADMHAATKQYVDSIIPPNTYVLKAGDTMTGDLVISKSVPVIQLNSPTVTTRGLQFRTNGVARWELFAWNDAESGGNAGSTFFMRRFDDAGALLGNIFSVDRATGRWTFLGSVLPRVPGVDPTDNNDVVRKAYADRSGPGGSTSLLATTSGTTYDVTSIPNWANVVEVFFAGITAAANTSLRVRLGTSSGFVSSGYTSATGSRTGEASDNTCFISFYLSTSPSTGIMRMVRAYGNTWVQTHVGFQSGNLLSGGGGNVDIGGTLTQIRVFVSSSNFTGGSFAVRWTA